MNKFSSLGGQLYPGQVGVRAEQKGANPPTQTDCLSVSQQRSPKAGLLPASGGVYGRSNEGLSTSVPGALGGQRFRNRLAKAIHS